MLSVKDLLSNSSLPRGEAEMLVSFILKKSRENILTHPEQAVSTEIQKQFKSLERKRLKHWPIAYLVGHKEFYGLDFAVNKNVLVPRPETEMMVDKITLQVCTNPTKNFNIIDIGTGSGAIIISIASELKRCNQLIFKQNKYIGIDVSEKALEVAKQNSKLNEIKRISFVKSNLLKDIPSSQLINKDLIIAANLPYLSPKQVKEEKSISQEPRLALVAGSDGLKYYRQLIKHLAKVKFKSLYLILEIDPSQTRELKVLICEAWKIRPEIVKDLKKNNRFIICSINQIIKE